MKFSSPRLCLVVASAALALAGCTKKPTRPDPSATVIGPAGNGSGAGLGSVMPMDLSTTTPGSDLMARGRFDANNQDRSALAAQTVYFNFNESHVKASERPKLQAAKDYLEKNPGERLLLEGHCDWRGTAEYNLALGDRRANEAKKYLQSIGVAPDRIETVSKGSLEASKNADAATMAKDRRVDIIVTQSGGASPAFGSGAEGAAGASSGTTPADGATGTRPGAL